MPTPSRAHAKAWEPRISASIKRRSKSSEPEKRSKISEGPSAKRPPQSFIVSYRFLMRLLRRSVFERCPYLDGQADEVDEAARVALVVFGAHGEAGDIERVERKGRLAADGLDAAFVEAQGDFAGGGFAGLVEKCVQRFAQGREPEAVIYQLGVIERELLLVVGEVLRKSEGFELPV